MTSREDTQRITNLNNDDVRYEAAKATWEARGDKNNPLRIEPGPELAWLPAEPPAGPPWNRLDTFLRRALMVGGTILIWLTLALGVVAAVGGGWVWSQLHQSSTSGLYNTDEPLLPPTEPAPGECDPDTDLC